MIETHFTLAEFACPCCGDCKIYKELVVKLELLRAELGGRPVHINSGWRCPEHNARVGGVSNSQHLLGKAADIVVPGVSPEKVAEGAEKVGFNGIGIYKNFTHVDIRERPARWRG